MRQGIEEIEFLSDPTAGEVRIGATDPINAAIVAPVIDRLSRQYPRMTFQVVAGVPAPLRQEVTARNVDFSISRFARPVGEEYSEEILFHDALVVVAGPDNPLTRRRKIVFAELLSEPWVLDSPNTDFGAMQAGVFRAAGLDPPRLTVTATSITLRNELLATERFLTVVVGFSRKTGRYSTTGRHHHVEESVTQSGRANVHRVRPPIGEAACEPPIGRRLHPLRGVRNWPIATLSQEFMSAMPRKRTNPNRRE
jgi:hypothetical protein